MITADNNNKNDDYEEILVILRLKKNVAVVGRLIAKYQYNDSFDKFASEEIRQAIIAIGPDYPKEVREYANRLMEGEEI